MISREELLIVIIVIIIMIEILFIYLEKIGLRDIGITVLSTLLLYMVIISNSINIYETINKYPKKV